MVVTEAVGEKQKERDTSSSSELSKSNGAIHAGRRCKRMSLEWLIGSTFVTLLRRRGQVKLTKHLPRKRRIFSSEYITDFN